ncbi:ATP-binding protein [Streptomyces sp. SID3343]|uniref:ATP-binding protein n=1 Tax=Streptomyces sp. SID3343 TaxID=2690260 RepID=UPI00136FEFC8|nr:ATP-binding protein [Streptomyces sp. SID3343]MYW05061.1 ATP-binding protein [Streptomyces sp. SID3343]
MVVARGMPDSAAVLVPHAPVGVSAARHRLSADLDAWGISLDVVDDAVLILSELLSNALRHARALPSGNVRAAWWVRPDGLLAIEVTDGGSSTRPRQASPSLSAHGGRGLSIIGTLAADWGVRGSHEEVTVWALVPVTRRSGDGLWDEFDLDAVEPLD